LVHGRLVAGGGEEIKHYEKFLSLWKEADPGIAEAEDARERLTGMKEMNNV
jgi:hypothetical protein